MCILCHYIFFIIIINLLFMKVYYQYLTIVFGWVTIDKNIVNLVQCNLPLIVPKQMFCVMQ